MNRPKWQECLPKTKYYVKDEYIIQLEKYCDDLEAMYDGLSKTLDTVSDYNEKLEKALEKITKALEKITKAINEQYNCPPNIGYCKDTKCGDCWKRWAMKDELEESVISEFEDEWGVTIKR